MNDDTPIDPALESLAARLSALRPRVPERDASELVYQCGFSAGRKSAARKARCRQLASAAMAILLVGASVSLLNDRALVARNEPANIPRTEIAPVQASPSVPRPTALVAVQPDAWQVRADAAASFETALARFRQLDASSRSLSLGAMAQSVGTVP